MSMGEIVELDHDKKLNAPSGTAKRTEQLIDAAGGNVHPPIHSICPAPAPSSPIARSPTSQTFTARLEKLL